MKRVPAATIRILVHRFLFQIGKLVTSLGKHYYIFQYINIAVLIIYRIGTPPPGKTKENKQKKTTRKKKMRKKDL